MLRRYGLRDHELEQPVSPRHTGSAFGKSPGSTKPSPTPIGELDRVVLQSDLTVDGRRLPRGSSGTVVAIWGGGEAFEVEFTKPFACLATIERALVSRQ
jgi:Domain of unknown function (DUF4926)